jgi:outer membrane protein OmpA-like peptidoglycan-associated protein
MYAYAVDRIDVPFGRCLMRWNVAAGLFAVLVVELHTALPADACGVKLTVKSSSPRKAVARTSNPSDILLLGNSPRRLELDLRSAGHRVEAAPTTSAAKRESYAVVIVDASLQDEARSSYPGAIVIVRSGDVVADVRSVEQSVARKPRSAEQQPAVVAARAARTPVAAGPERTNRRVVAATEPRDTPPVAEPIDSTPPPPPAPPERVAATVPRATPEPRATQATPAEPRPRVVAKANSVHDEVYFTIGRAQLGQTAALAKIVRWLTANGDVQVIIEGHADPTGSPEGNLALAQRRAEWVRDQLVAGGIDQGRLDVISYGDTRLRYGRTDRRNRRAAIVVK